MLMTYIYIYTYIHISTTHSSIHPSIHERMHLFTHTHASIHTSEHILGHAYTCVFELDNWFVDSFTESLKSNYPNSAEWWTLRTWRWKNLRVGNQSTFQHGKSFCQKKTKILILFSLLVKSILSSDKFVPRVWLQGYIPLLVASSRLQMAPRWENTNLPQFDPYLVANYPRIVSGL